MQRADEALISARKTVDGMRADQNRAHMLIEKLAMTRAADEADRLAGIKHHLPDIPKTELDEKVKVWKEQLKAKYGTTSAASREEKLAMATEIERAAREGMTISTEAGVVTGKLRIDVRSADHVTAMGNRFGAWLGLEAKPEAVKAKSLFGLVPKEGLQNLRNKIAGEGGILRSIWNTEGPLTEKFGNWMRTNFYRGDQDIARATLTYVNGDNRLVTYALNNSEILAMGDRMNLTLAAQGHTPSFLHGAHTTMDAPWGGYVDAETINFIGEPGSVTQFRMDYGTGTMLGRQRSATQYRSIIENSSGTSMWHESWNAKSAVPGAGDQALIWKDISGHATGATFMGTPTKAPTQIAPIQLTQPAPIQLVNRWVPHTATGSPIYLAPERMSQIQRDLADGRWAMDDPEINNFTPMQYVDGLMQGTDDASRQACSRPGATPRRS
jgi:hypothetical protein